MAPASSVWVRSRHWTGNKMSPHTVDALVDESCDQIRSPSDLVHIACNPDRPVDL